MIIENDIAKRGLCNSFYLTSPLLRQGDVFIPKLLY